MQNLLIFTWVPPPLLPTVARFLRSSFRVSSRLSASIFALFSLDSIRNCSYFPEFITYSVFCKNVFEINVDTYTKVGKVKLNPSSHLVHIFWSNIFDNERTYFVEEVFWYGVRLTENPNIYVVSLIQWFFQQYFRIIRINDGWKNILREINKV